MSSVVVYEHNSAWGQAAPTGKEYVAFLMEPDGKVLPIHFFANMPDKAERAALDFYEIKIGSERKRKEAQQKASQAFHSKRDKK